MTTRFAVSQKEHGFTLVELAIVLIIIGLLIGGTLKGQELINGARVTSTTAQVKALEAGALTFQDTYNGFPGDLLNAATRLPNCTSNTHCVLAGDTELGNGRVGATGDSAPTLALTPSLDNTSGPENESFAFFNHMFNADLLDGIDGTATATVGAGFLGAKLGSAKMFRVGYLSRVEDAPGNATGAGTLVDAPIRPGHYLYLSNNNDAVAVGAADNALNNAGITASEAGRIDAKYDDGAPNTGNVFAVGQDDTAGDGDGVIDTGECTSGNAVDSTYGTANRQNDCGLLIRFSN